MVRHQIKKRPAGAGTSTFSCPPGLTLRIRPRICEGHQVRAAIVTRQKRTIEDQIQGLIRHGSATTTVMSASCRAKHRFNICTRAQASVRPQQRDEAAEVLPQSRVLLPLTRGQSPAAVGSGTDLITETDGLPTRLKQGSELHQSGPL